LPPAWLLSRARCVCCCCCWLLLLGELLLQLQVQADGVQKQSQYGMLVLSVYYSGQSISGSGKIGR
jgi:hypothetical protein